MESAQAAENFTWYAVDKDVTDRAEAEVVSRAVLDLVRPRVRTARVDAYSDCADQFPPGIAEVERQLRDRGMARETGDPGMGIEVDPGDDEQWMLLRTYAPWSIHVEVWDDDDQVATLHDCGYSVTVRLTDRDAARLAEVLAPIAALERLDVVHARGREERRAHRQATLRRWLQRLALVPGSKHSGSQRTGGGGTSEDSRVSAPPTQLVGFSTVPGRGVGKQAGLYEFDTAVGERVYLHDTDCRVVTYCPGPRAVLTVEFEYDAEYTPPELSDRPVVVLTFTDVVVLRWEAEVAGLPALREADAPFGQVSAFDWDGARTFSLQLLAVTLTFTATTVEVTTRRS